MAKSKRRSASVAPEENTRMGTTERILQAVGQVYSGEEGLSAICKDLKVNCQKPRKTINIMIIGNHSAGKSSFINWFAGQSIQSVGVAIETAGFTLITPGKKRETLKGPATVQLFPHLQALSREPGMMENINCEVIMPPPERTNSHLITFIDTPGLVDGSFGYAFDVDKAMAVFAEMSDLVYVFFDPIGQALCARTMHIVSRINDLFPEKLRFYLSKADTVPEESDRQKVLIQITQNLSQHIRNKTFTLPTIYLPERQGSTGGAGKVQNKLDELCEEMEKTIQLTVQTTLNNLEQDCKAAETAVERALQEDQRTRSLNITRLVRFGTGTGLLFALLVTVLASFLHGLLGGYEFWKVSGGRAALLYDWGLNWKHYGVLLVAILVAFRILKHFTRRRNVLARSRVTTFKQYVQVVGAALETQRGLMREFFRELGVADMHN